MSAGMKKTAVILLSSKDGGGFADGCVCFSMCISDKIKSMERKAGCHFRILAFQYIGVNGCALNSFEVSSPK